MKYLIKQTKNLGISLLFLGALLYLSTANVLAFPVAPLPEDNLIVNPWFRSSSDPTRSSLDGWTDAAGLNKHWSSSQKESNPSQDLVIAGVCGGKQVYCGTAARLSPTPGQSGGLAEPEVDAYLYQVVSSRKTHQKLKFFAHWVSHRVEVAEVTIYGGDSPNGPWTSLWVPFFFEQLTLPPKTVGDRASEWNQTDLVETIIAVGYDFYKIEIHARFPEPRWRIGDIGLKITGVYFATELAGEAELTSPKPEASPTETPTSQPPPERERPRSRGGTPTTLPVPTPSPSQIPTKSLTSNSEIKSSVSPTAEPNHGENLRAEIQSGANPESDPRNNAFIGLTIVGLLTTIITAVILRMRRS
jgi:hypothetical protein